MDAKSADMEKHIYFVRHGQSEENVSHVHIGAGAKLTEVGREQARVLGERMRRIGIEALISSPFVRAVQTAAEVANATGVPMDESEFFGEWLEPSQVTGMHMDDPARKTVRETVRAAEDDHEFRHSDEETFSELVTRAHAALRTLEEHPSSRICVVTHGGFLRILLGIILFGTAFTKREFVRLLSHFITVNTGVTYVVYDEIHGWRLITLNDQSHLG